MNVVFGEMDNIIDDRREWQTSGTLNQLIKARACKLMVNEKTDQYLETNEGMAIGVETALAQSTFIDRVYKAYLKLMVPTTAAHYSVTPPPTDRDPKAVINLLTIIFQPCESNPTPLDRLAALTLCYQLNPRYSYYSGRDLYPYNFSSGMIKPAKVTDCRVEDFVGVGLLKMKVDKPSLCHVIEPFILLKEEINKIEAGLWEKIRDRINEMFATSNHYDFLKTALIFLSDIEPHYSDKLVERLEEDELLEDFMTPSINKCYDNLARRFKLDCHCESATFDWKECVIPKILERIFLMKAV